ncbi:TetR/AcrR family transcriptional regulator [Actinokineospora diospyrosa]|uniref:Transcriptional regulator, TetR family n=1 Tax=Actinokineospora diospyrosa TaxID=103728 RepID=A0ABT1IBM0_9PSEU|nr:TetR family transcriptional regulator [Actinokineospora diospyrosa]MCP2269961.1 transcriptional regulator, TetR family [Actinokineospora diospyrosa]
MAAPRRRDPLRRARIVEAAVEVIAESGLAALTHRAAAARARVPLGSTTYYFADLDELLEAAVRAVAERNVGRLRRWADSLTPGADLPVELAEFLVTLATRHRATSVSAYELYSAALRRPGLRAASTSWDAMLTEVFRAHMDRPTATAMTAMFDGLLFQALVSPARPTRADFEDPLRRVLRSG